MYRIGVTGGIASGKSLVSRMLGELGAHVIEADGVYGELVRPGSPLLDELAKEFGEETVARDGSLRRAVLAERAFGTVSGLRRLNEITHPPLTAEIERRLKELEREDPRGVAVVDAALLPDWEISRSLDLTVAVTAPVETRVVRMKEEGLSEAQARARVEAQRPDEWYAERADVVITNAGTKEELGEKVATLWRRVTSEGRTEKR
ncbi:MAG: dephospho-CoA kinase [Candidatus Eisenbacteria bacterium]|nr:dephospho-CoA kinase [Candidatus Eisenbacteria bacterium]